jgi:transposase-like protein
MTAAIVRDPIYRRRRFPAETIELCVRWYITYPLSYRDLAAMMAERGIAVSHTTIFLRWVLRYVPDYELAMGPIRTAHSHRIPLQSPVIEAS